MKRHLILAAVMALASVSSIAPSHAETLRGTISRIDTHVLGADFSTCEGVAYCFTEVALSADGSRIAFRTPAALVPEDTNGLWDVYVKDLESGTIELASAGSDGAISKAMSFGPVGISADGRYVGFRNDDILTPGSNRAGNIYLRDLKEHRTELISVTRDSTPGNERAGNASSLGPVSISDDGRYVAFASVAWDLVPGDTGSAQTAIDKTGEDIFVRDRELRTTERVSRPRAGGQPNGGSSWPSMSGDGRFVAFNSSASNLISGDTNEVTDVFVHDRQSDSTELVSVSSSGRAANDTSYRASISDDGTIVAFASFAETLVPAREMGCQNTLCSNGVFVRNRRTGQTSALIPGGPSATQNLAGREDFASVSKNGRFVVFSHGRGGPYDASDTGTTHGWYVADTVSREVSLLAPSVPSDGFLAAGFPSIAGVTADGSRIALVTTGALSSEDRDDVADMYLVRHGGLHGVGSLIAGSAGSRIDAHGWARSSGVVMGTADLNAGDSPDIAKDRGGALDSVSFAYFPEQQGIQVRIGVEGLRNIGDGPGRMQSQAQTTYNVTFRGPQGLLGYRFRIWNGSTAVTEEEVWVGDRPCEYGTCRTLANVPSGSMHTCAENLDRPASCYGDFFPGSIGTDGPNVVMWLPLRTKLWSFHEGDVLSDIAVSSSLFTRTLASQPLDIMELDAGTAGDVVIPKSRVELGLEGPDGAILPGMDFVTASADGRFEGHAATAGLAPGRYAVRARSCVGDECGAVVRYPVTVQ